MKLYIPHPDSLKGGVGSFFGKLSIYFLNRKDISITHEMDSSDVILNPIFLPVPKQYQYKSVHRVDGCYINLNLLPFPHKPFFFERFVEDRINYVIKQNHIRSHACIYQSRFSSELHKHKFGSKNLSSQTMITNPSVVQEKIVPRSGITTKTLTVFYAHRLRTVHRYTDLFPVLDELIRRGYRITLKALIAGTFDPYVYRSNTYSDFERRAILLQSRYPSFFHIDLVKNATSQQLNEARLSSDFSINFSYQDPCPNVVVDNCASALPTFSVRSGGIQEILEGSNDLLFNEQISLNDIHAGFGTRIHPHINHKAFTDFIEENLGKLASLSEYVADIAERNHRPSVVFESYLHFLDKFASS